MKALTYQGKRNVKVKEVKDPRIEKQDDIVVRITSTAICGSDLHIFNGETPVIHDDYVVGHEPMGIVEEVGPGVTRVKKGDRVVIPFNVACGECFFCKNQMESQCDNSNEMEEKNTGAYFGFDIYGGYPGGQAELMRVPYANFLPFVIPESAEVTDEQVLFLSDIMPTAFWSVESGGVKAGDTVIILGCGPVGLLAQKFVWQKGAKRVIAVDHIPYRLAHAKRTNNVEVVNFKEVPDVDQYLLELTSGGADVVIDCVGLDADKSTAEKIQTSLKLQGGGLGAFRIAANVVRKFGTIQVTGVYGENYNMFPLGHLFERNVKLAMGQAPVVHYMPQLFKQITDGTIDPTDIITHKLSLSDAERGYDLFDNKKEDCIKVILKP
ncbi:zinc-dependent alcohol dehydrogenase [Paenibacillus shenyangensis]|uniref:zinc-dependent alcohol dehydrogenase n=1 Tax=Paenibacillus sp. A9 TaxID=1284352 RepID=UPI0003647F5D|nr:zinc-dependent alcohol dehydrogenase [Paenibacillus sp. A9]